MKLINKLILLSLLFLVVTACQKRDTDESAVSCASNFGWTDSSEAHPKNAVLSKMITELTAKGMPGISVMLEDSNGIWYKSSGFADIGNNTKMSPCHLVKIASVTKLFTTALIYKLVDEGKLNLDDLASDYIDKKHIDNIENLEKTRIRDLLAHSSGIYDVVFDSEFILYTFNNLNEAKSYDELLDFAHGKKAEFEYNSKQKYNQTLNHVVLAMIVNKITGVDQSAKLRQEILNPLAMLNTYIRPQEMIPWNQVAKGYYDYRKEGVLQDLTPLFIGDGRGFTGIYSNVNDLRLFTNAMFREKRLMSQAMFAEMTTKQSADPSINLANGCRVNTITVDGKVYKWYGHPGGEVNYASGAFYCPALNATLTWTVNYGVAFQDLGAYTQSYYDFREKLFEEVSR
jgi:D-alanyl-D-alanine carboxypeptidase